MSVQADFKIFITKATGYLSEMRLHSSSTINGKAQVMKMYMYLSKINEEPPIATYEEVKKPVYVSEIHINIPDEAPQSPAVSQPQP